mgnify:CR=1 FL=1
MKLLHCPLNGPRNISEFTYGGECRDMPDPDRSTREDWAEYVFFNDNPADVITEWWCHTATSYWFLAERDTRNDAVLRTYDPVERFGSRVDDK